MCIRDRTAPRHLCVHSVLSCFYMTNEIESSVSVFRVDRNRFTFHSIQTVPTLPGQVHEKNGPGDIKLHPSGKYLYVTNRGYDSIAVYEISQVSGLLTLKQVYKVKYANLRSCAGARDGRHLIACSQYDDKVLSFSLSPKTGEVEEIVMSLIHIYRHDKEVDDFGTE